MGDVPLHTRPMMTFTCSLAYHLLRAVRGSA